MDIVSHLDNYSSILPGAKDVFLYDASRRLSDHRNVADIFRAHVPGGTPGGTSEI